MNRRVWPKVVITRTLPAWWVQAHHGVLCQRATQWQAHQENHAGFPPASLDVLVAGISTPRVSAEDCRDGRAKGIFFFFISHSFENANQGVAKKRGVLIIFFQYKTLDFHHS